MSNDRQAHRPVLGFDLVAPDFRISVCIPARRYILRATGRRDEDSIGAQGFHIARGLNDLLGRQSPGTGENRHFTVSLLHCNLKHPPLLGPRQVEDLTGLRVDAQPAGQDETWLPQEVLNVSAISSLVDLQRFRQRQQTGDVIAAGDIRQDATPGLTSECAAPPAPHDPLILLAALDSTTSEFTLSAS